MDALTRTALPGGKKRRRRLKKPVRRFLWGAGFVLLMVVILPPVFRIAGNSDGRSHGPAQVTNFRDLNKEHLRYAKSRGIVPLKAGDDAREQAEKLAGQGRLVAVKDNRYYVVAHLTHSYPYLIPEASALLDEIGKRFRKKLKEKEMPEYHFKVTSLLRTPDSQKRLRSANGNATTQSAHLYGTTFDITYKSLTKKNFLGGERSVADGAALRLLSETIGELRQEKKLVVVTEKKERCFHITVRK